MNRYKGKYPKCPKGHPMVTDKKTTEQMKLLKERWFVCRKCKFSEKRTDESLSVGSLH